LNVSRKSFSASLANGYTRPRQNLSHRAEAIRHRYSRLHEVMFGSRPEELKLESARPSGADAGADIPEWPLGAERIDNDIQHICMEHGCIARIGRVDVCYARRAA
jgi:hypothetical protein